MTINELLAQIDDENIERETHLIRIVNLEDKFSSEDIVINTNTLQIRNKNVELVPVTVKAIYFANCTFKSIDLTTKIDIKYFDCENVNVNDLLIENQILARLSLNGIFNNFKLKKSNLEHTYIDSTNHSHLPNLIEFKDSEVKNIEIRVEQIKHMSFTSLKNCDKLIINTGGRIMGSPTTGIFEKITFFYCSNIGHISISTLILPLHINTFYLDKFFNVKELELQNITLDYSNINSRKVYDNLNLNLSDVDIIQRFETRNIDFGQSVFKNINLSKCLFRNSLISKSLFYECKVDKIPDIPLVKFKKIAFAFIFFIPVLIAIININFTGSWKENLTDSLTSTLPYVFVFLLISFLLFFYKHVATLDEDREKHKGFSDNHLKAINEFLQSTYKSLKSFFWKVDEHELRKLQGIESVNRQLKVAFDKSKDSQNANEFVYSEMLMKIRQKNIWSNLLSVDLWNYLINGFGRRWRRALMNFVVIFVIAIFAFMDSAPFQFVVKEKAPAFILDANQTVFSVIPKDLDVGLISAIKINDANKTQESNNTLDAQPIINNLFNLSAIYTLSKIDIFKVKTNGWFEETSPWNFLKANVIGLVLLFLLGAFALAFKRRLDK